MLMEGFGCSAARLADCTEALGASRLLERLQLGFMRRFGGLAGALVRLEDSCCCLAASDRAVRAPLRYDRAIQMVSSAATAATTLAMSPTVAHSISHITVVIVDDSARRRCTRGYATQRASASSSL